MPGGQGKGTRGQGTGPGASGGRRRQDTGGAATFTRSQKERIASRVTRNGHEYVKINLAELFVVAENGDQAKLGCLAQDHE